MSNILRPSRREMIILRKMFLESCKLKGITCKLYEPINRDIPQVSTTETYTYDFVTGSKSYFLHFESSPKKKLLERFGFSPEAKEHLPLIADCPTFRYAGAGDYSSSVIESFGTKLVEVNLSEGCLIEVEMYEGMSLTPTIHRYEVEKVLASDDGVHYIANLVPYRSLSTGLTGDLVPDSGSKFIKQSDE